MHCSTVLRRNSNGFQKLITMQKLLWKNGFIQAWKEAPLQTASDLQNKSWKQKDYRQPSRLKIREKSLIFINSCWSNKRGIFPNLIVIFEKRDIFGAFSTTLNYLACKTHQLVNCRSMQSVGTLDENH